MRKAIREDASHVCRVYNIGPSRHVVDVVSIFVSRRATPRHATQFPFFFSLRIALIFSFRFLFFFFFSFLPPFSTA